MSLIFFTEKGERVPKIHYLEASDTPLAGWMTDVLGRTTYGGRNGWGFLDQRSFIPGWIAIKMARGYRVITRDHVATWTFWIADDSEIWTEWWKPASPEHKRLPHVAAVEMWVRMQAATR